MIRVTEIRIRQARPDEWFDHHPTDTCYSITVELTGNDLRPGAFYDIGAAVLRAIKGMTQFSFPSQARRLTVKTKAKEAA